VQEKDETQTGPNKYAMRCLYSFLAFVLIHTVLVPVPVSIAAPALEIRADDPDHIAEHQVRIEGRWRIGHNFMSGLHHNFEGYIYIDGYPADEASEFQVPFFRRDNDGFSGVLARDGVFFGTFSSGFLFRRDVFIVVFVETYARTGNRRMRVLDTDTNSPLIVLNAESREHALEIVRQNEWVWSMLKPSGEDEDPEC